MPSRISSRAVARSILGGLMLLASFAHAAPDSYRSQIMADGPIGYWRLGEVTGTTATDSSGRGNSGTYSGGVTLGQPGFHGGDTAALFDGASGRVVVPNSATLNPRNITMEAKLRWDGPNTFQQRILEKSFFLTPGQEQAQYALNILEDGHVRVELRTGTAGVDPICSGWGNNVVCANSTATVPIGVETHIAATYDAKEVRIYINGALDSSTVAVAAGPIQAVPPDPTHVPYDALGIGNQSVRNHRPFKGLLDEVALFERALPADRIRAHYQSQFEEARTTFEYAVKFVCGKSAGTVVAPGTYFTAINVHNPNERAIAFQKKFAIALPGERPGRVSRFHEARLGPDEAFEIDCPDILRRTETRDGFLKGFAVLKTELELDVVAVYTAAGTTGGVETMEIERVAPRVPKGTGRPDLVPAPDPRLGFCRRRDSKLIVTVKNQGSADAAASTTKVDFGTGGGSSQPTPPIPAGGSADLLFDIPPGCFRPDCSFRITVDSNSQVDESNELNNIADGKCLG